MSVTLAAPSHPELLLVPMTEALARVRERDVRVHVLTPPYPCFGSGALRVVRALERGDALDLEVTYEHYVKNMALRAKLGERAGM